MQTISFENIDLRVMQQSSEIQEVGVQNMRGALSVNHDEGVATFVEDKKRACGKNPVFWEGHHVKMRINKDGKLRLTVCIEVPSKVEDLDVLVDDLDEDFVKATNKICDLSNAKRPKTKKVKRVA